MLRIYCDKNIYSSIKPGKGNFIPELKELMDELKGKMVFTYSTAHHNDLANSDESYWNEDLILMEEYVEDNYFFYNSIKKETEIYLAKPMESFYDLNHEKEIDIDQTIQNLLKDIEEPFRGMLKSLLEGLLNLKMPSVRESLKTEKDIELFEKYKLYLPEGENNTLKDYLQLGNKLLFDKEEVKKMKRLMEEYSNSDNYSFEKWKEKYDEKFSEVFYGETFTGMMEGVFNAVDGYNNYDKFTLFFASLEMYNITKDKPLRKTQALASNQTDADHAWYASFSDFLVTNDKGLAMKAHITYKYFNIETKILTIEEFLSEKINFLQQEERSVKKLEESLMYELQNGLIFKKIEDFSVLQCQYPFFNYFNRILCKNNSIVLFCERTNNVDQMMLKEIKLLIGKLYDLFGFDKNGRGMFTIKKKGFNEVFREWRFKDLTILFYTNYNENIKSCCLEIMTKEKL
ncbi:MAG TPA: hypothetical protein VK021_07805 [Flavobacteriaceae bacterium]|nr:hypothetical protein [Flavobacteriaceae bacterium]